MRRRLTFVLALAVSVALAAPIEASGWYRQGWDPNDIDGAGDIRLVSVRRYARAGTAYIRVMVRLHSDSDLAADGVAKWKLDGRGGPRMDHLAWLTFDTDGGLKGCRMRRIGHWTREGSVRHPRKGYGCRFELSDTRFTRIPRFRAGILTVHDPTLVETHDRAPNDRRRWYR